MTKVTRWLVAGVAMVCVVALAACGSGNSSGGSDGSTDVKAQTTKKLPDVPPDPNAADVSAPEPGSGKGVKIGYISDGEFIPFVKINSDSIKRAAKAAGATLLFCDSELDAAKAIDCAKSLKTRGAEVGGYYQQYPEAAPKVCAQGPQVPVIAIDVPQDPCEVSFMGVNNLRSGEVAGVGTGEFFKKKFNCKYDKIIALTVLAAGKVTEDRIQGEKNGFEKICGPIPADKYRVLDGGGSIDTVRPKFADVLTTIPDAKKIILFNINEGMALGAVAAAKSQNREDQVFVGGQGGDPSAYCEIKTNPNWIGSSAMFPELYGEVFVKAAIKLAKGETIPKQMYLPHIFLTKDNIDKYYDTANC